MTLSASGMLYLNVSVYPLVTGGKPYGAVEPLVPILFEATVLFAALAAVAGLLALSGLPKLDHPLFAHSDFARVTNDGFFVLIDGRDRQLRLGSGRAVREPYRGRSDLRGRQLRCVGSCWSSFAWRWRYRSSSVCEAQNLAGVR